MPPPCRDLLRADRIADDAQEVGPRPNFAEVRDRARPIGIVEVENRRLREHIGGAAAARVIGVALDLGRPPLVALDEQPGADAAEGHRRRVVKRPARHDLLGLPDVWDDLLGGLARAGGHPGEPERGAHELEKGSPLNRIGDRFDLRRELVVAAAPGTRDRLPARRASARTPFGASARFGGLRAGCPGARFRMSRFIGGTWSSS